MLLAPLTMVPVLTLLGVPLWALAAIGFAPPPGVLAALLTAVLVLSTRAMHLDGLADTADGLSASYDRERALEVMKRSDIGPSGVAAIVLALALQIASLAALASTGGALWLAAVAVLASRQALAWACHRRIPSATPGGLGATVAGTVSTAALATSWFCLFTVALVACFVTGLPLAAGVAVVVAPLVAVLALLARCRRRLGGITGDVLGACVEISLTTALATAALATTASAVLVTA